MEDWDGQRAFLAILRTGSLSAAARALGVTQPTMRRRLDRLEQLYGSALFTRTASGLVPTRAAQGLRDHAERMADAAQAFARAASGGADPLSGAVRVTASEVFSAEVLPGLLAGLRRRHPQLSVEIDASNRVGDLTRQQADVAIRMVRPTQLALVARHVGEVPLGLYAHRDYLARAGAPGDAGALAGHALIGSDRNIEDFEQMRAAGLDVRPEALAIRADSHLVQLAAIRAGLGIGICQSALAARDSALVAVLPDIFAPRLGIWIVMHEDLRNDARVRTVFDELARTVRAWAATTPCFTTPLMRSETPWRSPLWTRPPH